MLIIVLPTVLYRVTPFIKSLSHVLFLIHSLIHLTNIYDIPTILGTVLRFRQKCPLPSQSLWDVREDLKQVITVNKS